MTNWHGGKGSSRRTSIVTDAQVEDNWNAIFGKKSEGAVNWGTLVQDVTLNELKRILSQNNLEYFIKEQNENIIKIHFYVKDEEIS